ncbi:membrane protein [Pontibacillus halophilus JSM 076056 = DSM 19796]|uniref:Membrane protein n=1 Tax=Pontibacillus halophilus JSM 076056 = DSM 19796 TaxID=1385510 RepID=A0A0A5GH52_9BACI|nr:DUF1232 domain-containing protein [Pontibacillus halophilus]KGX90523.1 membrane protein [Pontibacillus halophilus JSM 076056 = DSM 19796]
MRFFRRIRFLFRFHKSIPFLKDFFLSKEVKNVNKVISVGLIIGYFLLPLDLIPDVIAFFGILDDVAIFTFILQQIVKMAPQQLKEKHDVE